MDFHGFSWIFMDFHGFSWIFMDFHSVSLNPLEDLNEKVFRFLCVEAQLHFQELRSFTGNA